MKILAVLISILIIQGCSNHPFYKSIDILCASGGFKAIKLTEEYRTDEGLVIPTGAVVYMRACEYSSQAYVLFGIEPSFNQYTEMSSSHGK